MQHGPEYGLLGKIVLPHELEEMLLAFPAVREALEAQDVQALDLALRQLPAQQALRLMQRLVEAGLVAERSQEDLDAEQRRAFGIE